MSARPGLLLIGGGASGRAELAAELEGAGFMVRECAGAELELPDRAAVAALRRALQELAARPGADARRLAAVGLGRGGTLAFLLGCTERLAAVVDVGGALSYAQLSAERPAQPLELALNLEGACLVVLAGESAAAAPAEIELLRATLSSAGKSFDIVVYPGAGEGFFDRGGPGFAEAKAADLWRRVVAFLHAAITDGDDGR